MTAARASPGAGGHGLRRLASARAWTTLIMAVNVAGCAAGPDFQRPAAPAAVAYTATPLPTDTVAADGVRQHLHTGAEPVREWWHAFGSPQLDALVDEALRHSPTLEAADATLRQARESAAAARASFWPEVDVTAGTSRSRDAIQVLQGTLQSGEPLYALHDARVSVAYVLDVVGGVRRANESAAAAAEQAAWQRDAAQLSLVANVVTTAFIAAGLREQIDATARTLDLQHESLAILRREFALGAIAEVDVRAQEAAVAQSETTLPPLRAQLAQARDRLAVLLGRLPADASRDEPRLADLGVPADVPLSVPARLVERRPDVRSAEAALHAATADLGVAVAAERPVLALAGMLGSTSTAKLFVGGTGYWSGTASLSQLLFDAGGRRHRSRAAAAALDAAGAEYRLAVLTAYQNVADSLHALEQDAASVDAAERAARAADATLAIVRRELELGAVPYLALVTAEQSALQAGQTLAQARSARLADCAALFAALAGNATEPGR